MRKSKARITPRACTRSLNLEIEANTLLEIYERVNEPLLLANCSSILVPSQQGVQANSEVDFSHLDNCPNITRRLNLVKTNILSPSPGPSLMIQP